MNKKEFNRNLASHLDIDAKDASRISTRLCDHITQLLAQGNEVAIPSFGKFTTEKEDEHVCCSSDGKSILMPPEITVQFSESVVLSNRLTK